MWCILQLKGRRLLLNHRAQGTRFKEQEENPILRQAQDKIQGTRKNTKLTDSYVYQLNERHYKKLTDKKCWYCGRPIKQKPPRVLDEAASSSG